MEEKHSSPGSIGAKMKKIRELREMTQRELGLNCGFAEGSAKTRISYYEGGQKIPKQDAVNRIAEILNVDEEYFSYTDHADFKAMVHALFDIEEVYGLRPYKQGDGTVVLRFGKPFRRYNPIYQELIRKFLNEWSTMADAYSPDTRDPNVLQKAHDEYTLWRASYFQHLDDDANEDLADEEELKRLAKQMEEVKARMAARKGEKKERAEEQSDLKD